MREEILYRKATIKDCYSIAELKGKVWNTTYKGIYSDASLQGYDVKKNQAIFETIIANPDIELYVATENSKIVGFMTCGKPYKPFEDFDQEVGLLYILKEYQRRGIGRAFWKIATQQVSQSGYDKFLVSVNSKNYGALEFYLAMGGKVVYTDEKQIKISCKVK